MEVHCSECMGEILATSRFCCHCGAPNSELGGAAGEPVHGFMDRLDRILGAHVQVALRPICQRLDILEHSKDESKDESRAAAGSQSRRSSWLPADGLAEPAADRLAGPPAMEQHPASAAAARPRSRSTQRQPRSSPSLSPARTRAHHDDLVGGAHKSDLLGDAPRSHQDRLLLGGASKGAIGHAASTFGSDSSHAADAAAGAAKVGKKLCSVCSWKLVWLGAIVALGLP